VVVDDTDYGWASVGVLNDRNQERQFGMKPIHFTNAKKSNRGVCKMNDSIYEALKKSI
jgi:hypothetical protein